MFSFGRGQLCFSFLHYKASSSAPAPARKKHGKRSILRHCSWVSGFSIFFFFIKGTRLGNLVGGGKWWRSVDTTQGRAVRVAGMELPKCLGLCGGGDYFSPLESGIWSFSQGKLLCTTLWSLNLTHLKLLLCWEHNFMAHLWPGNGLCNVP